jgi:hypothetical protein
MYKYQGIVKATLNQITNLLVLLLLISFITSITAITHAQENEACMGGGCYPSTPPQETPNRGGPTVNTTTSDVASNSTINVQQQNNSTGSTP